MLTPNEGVCEPVGEGCTGGAAGEEAEPDGSGGDAPLSGRETGNGGATAAPGSLDRKKISLSSS